MNTLQNTAGSFKNCSTNNEQRVHLSLLLQRTQTSAPHINNFPFLLPSLQSPPAPLPHFERIQILFLSDRPIGRTFSDTPVRARTASEVGVQGSGGRGVVRVRAEVWGPDTLPRFSLSYFPSLKFLTPDAGQRAIGL